MSQSCISKHKASGNDCLRCNELGCDELGSDEFGQGATGKCVDHADNHLYVEIGCEERCFLLRSTVF